MVCLPAKEFQQDGSHESENQLSWGESKMEELQRQQLSSVYHQGITSEGQVKEEEGEGDGRRPGRLWFEVDICIVCVGLRTWLSPLSCGALLQEGDYLFRLKNIAFSSLSKLLCSGEFKCSFMSQQDKTDLLK